MANHAGPDAVAECTLAMNTTGSISSPSPCAEVASAAAVDGSSRHYPIWLWPHLLSLDAPLVAAAWCALLARTLHQNVQPTTILVLATVVWIIYAADRLLDVRFSLPDTARHRFARDHRLVLLPAVTAAGLLAAVLGLLVLPVGTLMFGMAAVAAVAIYFIWIHHGRSREVQPGLKRLPVAVLFGAGVVLPLTMSWSLALGWAATSAVVWLNILAIDRWQSSGRSSFAVTLGSAVTGIACLLLGAFGTFYDALALGSFLIFGLNAWREHLSPDALRVTVDMALLVPALALLLR